jgi:hypothetical protein
LAGSCNNHLLLVVVLAVIAVECFIPSV